MGNADATHFDEYREQTRIKHHILQQYLPAYLAILSTSHKNILYLDAFAGRGSYTDTTSGSSRPGSPILAMELAAAKPAWQSGLQCVFVEAREDHFKNLDGTVKAQQASKPLAKPPHVIKGDCADLIDDLRSHFTGDLAPTFFFVDPCGVSGVRLADLTEVLKREWCELFLFFNYEGVNRIAGNREQEKNSPTLNDLLGSPERVDALVTRLGSLQSQDDREGAILSAFLDALQSDSGARFILPFRIECEHRKSTSHYLVHATKHPLGFRIMKDVMWKAGKLGPNDPGGLHLKQSSGPYSGLFVREDLQEAEDRILEALKNGKRLVGDFTYGWVERPGDFFSTDAYKQCLLRLESASKIVVLNKSGEGIAPPRKTRNGESTLAKDYWVSLPPKA